jgi:hypothetical protein
MKELAWASANDLNGFMAPREKVRIARAVRELLVDPVSG